VKEHVMQIQVTWDTTIVESYSATIELPEDIAALVAATRAADPDLTLDEALAQVTYATNYEFTLEALLLDEEVDENQTNVDTTDRETTSVVEHAEPSDVKGRS